MQFSANLGFLWQDLLLPDAIRAAKAAGFDAVECHWPYAVPAADVKAALDETGLPMLGLNTVRGNLEKGENGLSALPGREEEARAAIDDAVRYAAATGTGNIHVMAGFAQGAAAENCFVQSLNYACAQAAEQGITIVIEPLNHYDAPGYFLSTTGHAEEIIARVNAPNLKLMFDCYHVQLMEGDLTNKLRRLQPILGHVQFARVPDRGPPVGGEVNFAHVFEVIAEMGWEVPLGAEYKAQGPTEDHLGWMATFRKER